MKGEFLAIRCLQPGLEAIIARSRHSFARHTHDQFGIGVIEQGGQLWHSRRGQVEAGPGNVISVSPGEVHDGDPVGDSGRTWRMLFIHPSIVLKAAAQFAGGNGNNFELSRPVIANVRLARLFNSLFEAMTTPVDDMRREELMLRVLSPMGRHCDSEITAPPHPQIARAKSRIDDEPCTPITLADLAGLGDLNQYQLLRAFKRATGLTPHAYIVQRRVQLAKGLIAAGAGLANAAAESGFADQSHMTRAFVRRYGLTPGAYALAACPARPST